MHYTSLSFTFHTNVLINEDSIIYIYQFLSNSSVFEVPRSQYHVYMPKSTHICKELGNRVFICICFLKIVLFFFLKINLLKNIDWHIFY